MKGAASTAPLTLSTIVILRERERAAARERDRKPAPSEVEGDLLFADIQNNRSFAARSLHKLGSRLLRMTVKERLVTPQCEAAL